MDGSVAENAKNLATAILAICAAEVLEALSGWIAGKSNFSDFGQAIRSVTEAIMEINEAVSGEGNEFDNKAVKQVISCINGMVEIANALGVTRSNVSQNIRSDHITLDTMRKIANAIGCDIEIVIKPKSE